MLDAEEIIARRVTGQGLWKSSWSQPADVVSALGAVQAQDYPGARWALGQRARGLTDADVERAFDEGAILRTHAMRPTWHFVTPADIRWLQALTGPRVHRLNGTMYRRTELDAATLAKSRRVLERALRDRTYLTRSELAAALEKAGIRAASVRLAYLVMHAELDAIICSGPRRGAQFTYALLEERAAPAPRRSREEALAELVRRYFSSHGPATIRDFAWWSGLTAGEARIGVSLLGDALVEESFAGRSYWLVPSKTPRLPPAPRVWLLPNYDELGIAYRDRDIVPGVPRPPATAVNGEAPHLLFVDRQLAGRWRRVPARGGIRLDIHPYRRLTPREARAVERAVAAFRDFAGCPVSHGRP